MALGIYAFGHGGGVPGSIPGTPVVAAGNTNFALIPNLEPDDIRHMTQIWRERKSSPSLVGAYTDAHDYDGWPVAEILQKKPFWLIDCGSETALQLCGVRVQGSSPYPVVKNLRGIFLTHAHDDHSGGLKSLGYRCKYIEGTKPNLYLPSGSLETTALTLAGMVHNQTLEMAFHNPHYDGPRNLTAYYELPRMPDIQLPFTIDAFRVDHNCYDSEGHAMPAYGYKVITASGKTIVFSGDTAYPLSMKGLEKENVAFAIHDVQFYAPHDPTTDKQKYVHCPYGLLRDAVPPDLRHKVLLTHTSHELPPEAVADGFRLLPGGTLLVVD